MADPKTRKFVFGPGKHGGFALREKGEGEISTHDDREKGIAAAKKAAKAAKPSMLRIYDDSGANPEIITY